MSLVKPLARSLVTPLPRSLIEGVGAALAVPRAFTALMQAGVVDPKLAFIGTSIGNDWEDEHVGRLDRLWAATFPNHVIRNQRYVATPPSAGAYSDCALAGYSAGSALFADNFNRADGAVGTSSGGQSYTGTASWSISGNHLVQTSGASPLITANDLGTDKSIHTLRFVYGSITDSARVYGLYTSTSNCVFLSIVTSGVATLFYQPGGVTLVAVDTGADLVDGEVVDMELVIDGDMLQGKITRGATVTRLCAILSSVQKAALTGTKAAWTKTAGGGSAYFDDISVTAIAEPRRMTTVNASVSGASCAYHITNIATTLPSAVDLVVIEMSHNEGSAGVATFHSSLDSLVAAVRGQVPDVPIAIMMENPEVSPATNYVAHNARVASLPVYAAARGFGLINGYDGFDTANLNVDGIHPLSAGSAFLSQRDAAAFGIAA